MKQVDITDVELLQLFTINKTLGELEAGLVNVKQNIDTISENTKDTNTKVSELFEIIHEVKSTQYCESNKQQIDMFHKELDKVKEQIIEITSFTSGKQQGILATLKTSRFILIGVGILIGIIIDHNEQIIKLLQSIN